MHYITFSGPGSGPESSNSDEENLLSESSFASFEKLQISLDELRGATPEERLDDLKNKLERRLFRVDSTLGSKAAELAQNSVDALAKLTLRGADYLREIEAIDALRSGEREAQTDAVEILASIQSAASTNALLELGITDKHSLVRAKSALALHGRDSQRVGRELHAMAQREATDFVLFAARMSFDSLSSENQPVVELVSFDSDVTRGAMLMEHVYSRAKQEVVSRCARYVKGGGLEKLQRRAREALEEGEDSANLSLLKNNKKLPSLKVSRKRLRKGQAAATEVVENAMHDLSTLGLVNVARSFSYNCEAIWIKPELIVDEQKDPRVRKLLRALSEWDSKRFCELLLESTVLSGESI